MTAFLLAATAKGTAIAAVFAQWDARGLRRCPLTVPAAGAPLSRDRGEKRVVSDGTAAWSVCVCARAWRVDVGWLMLGLWSWGREGEAIDQVATARGANALAPQHHASIRPRVMFLLGDG